MRRRVVEVASAVLSIGGIVLSALGAHQDWDNWVWYVLAPGMIVAGITVLGFTLWPGGQREAAVPTPSLRPPSAAFVGERNRIDVEDFETSAQRLVEGSDNTFKGRRASHNPDGR